MPIFTPCSVCNTPATCTVTAACHFSDCQLERARTDGIPHSLLKQNQRPKVKSKLHPWCVHCVTENFCARVKYCVRESIAEQTGHQPHPQKSYTPADQIACAKSFGLSVSGYSDEFGVMVEIAPGVSKPLLDLVRRL